MHAGCPSAKYLLLRCAKSVPSEQGHMCCAVRKARDVSGDENR